MSDMSTVEVFGSPEEQLAVVNDAIFKVLVAGQSYQIGTRKLTRADLALLQDMQVKLQAQIADRSNNNSLFPDTVVGVFDGR